MTPFAVTSADDMFQRKIINYSKTPNASGIEEGIFVVGHREHDTKHDTTLSKVFQIYREDKFHFRCTHVPFFEIISMQGVTETPTSYEH